MTRHEPRRREVEAGSHEKIKHRLLPKHRAQDQVARARRHPEQALHRACAQFLDIALPTDSVWFHPANGGARSPVEAAIFKGLGVKPGVPDLVIVHRGRFIAIELKGPNGRLTPAQKAMHERLQLAGAVVTTAKSLEELQDFLSQIVPLRASLSGPSRPGHTRPGRSTDRE